MENDDGDSAVEHLFIGREEFLNELSSAWSHYRIFGIFGMRSVGKSRTVETFIKNIISFAKSPGRLTCVDVNLQHVHSEERLCSQLAFSFDIAHQDLDLNALLGEIHNRISKGERSFILNIDNAEDVIDSSAKDHLVHICKMLTKTNPYLKIILTSTVKIYISGSYYWTELPPMNDHDSVALLQSITPDIHYPPSTIDTIARLCLGLPLALLMTGAELVQGDLLPEDMVVILNKCRVEALSRTDFYAESESVGPVYANYIDRLSDVFKERLTVLGYIPGSFTSKQAQQILGDQPSSMLTMDTLKVLKRRHMLEWEFQHCRYNIHAILRDTLSAYYTISHLDEVRKRYCATFCEVMVDLAMRLTSGEHSDAISAIAVEHPNIQKLLLDVEHSGQETYPLYIHMVTSSSALIEQYFGGESFQFYDKCLELSRQYKKAYDVAVVSGAYGRVLTNVKSEFTKGEMMYLQALGYVDDNPDQVLSSQLGAQIHQNMGWNLHKQGYNKAAVRHLHKALDFQTDLGWKHEVVSLSTLSTLGVVNTAMGNFDEGERYHLLCLERRIEKYGENHPHVGASYNNIGILYDQKRDAEKAAHYYRRGLEVKKQTRALPLAIVLSLNNVALAEKRLGNIDLALANLREAIDLLQEMPGMYSYEEALTLDNLGQIFLHTGDYQKAVETLSLAADKRKNDIGKDVVYVESLLHLGKALKEHGEMMRAMTVFREALSLKERAAEQMPQNEFILNSLSEMIDIVIEGQPGGDNWDMLREIFTDSRTELVRIIEHFRGKGLYGPAGIYDGKLRVLENKKKSYLSK